MGAINCLWNDPRCVRGDFKINRVPDEHKNGLSSLAEMRKFSQIIDELELKDYLRKEVSLLG